MKTKFHIGWKKSTQPRKQRKYRYEAPLHVKQKFVRAQLSKELHKKYGKRSLGVRVGDKVKVTAGHFKGKTGKVEFVNVKKTKVQIAGLEVTKKDGTKVSCWSNPSNLLITDLNTDDARRRKLLEK
jgi:large subunit ribosomal protein L24